MNADSQSSREPERLQTLRNYQILDTPAEASYDEVVKLLAHLCEAPIATITFLDERRQWFKSCLGLPMVETDRSIAFCDITIRGNEPFIIADTQLDPRFADNPLVVGEPYVRFYAGVPLRTGQGVALGTLTVMDVQPRQLSEVQLNALQVLAHQVMNHLELSALHRRHEQILAARQDIEDALHRQTEHLETTQRIAHIGSWELDFATNLVQWSDEIYRIFAIRRDQFSGTLEAFLSCIHPDDRLDYVAARTRAIAGEESMDTVCRIVRLDGEVRTVNIRGEVQFDAAGNAYAFAGTAQDVTEQRRSTQQIESFFELSVDWLCIAGMDGYVRKLNQAMARAIGYSHDEILSTPFLHYVHEDDVDRTRNELESLLEGKPSISFEARFRTNTGDVRLVEWSVLPIVDERLLYAVGRDITRQREAERALRQSEQRFARLFSSAAAGITLCLPDGRYIQANPAFCLAVGYEEDELRQLSWQTITDPMDSSKANDSVRQLLAGEIDSFVLEKRYVHKDGSTVWVRESVSCVCSDNDEPLYVISVSEDITERVNARSAVSGLQQQLAMTLENMTDAFCILNRNWQVMYINREAERLVLHSADSVRNITLWERFPPTMRSALYTEFHRAVDTGEPVHFELYYPPLENWFEVHAYPYSEGLGVYFRVITERKLAEAALRESEERFRQLAETIDDVFWIWDPREDRIIYASPRYEAVFGRSREELYANPRSFAWDMHPEDRKRLADAAYEDPYSIKIQYRLILPDGLVRWVSVRTFPIYDEEGNIRHSVGIGQDITQLVEATERLRASEQQYRLLFTNNPHPMWVYDINTLRILAVNERAIAHYGYTEAEFLALTILDIRPKEEIPRVRQALLEFVPRNEIGVWKHQKKDGTVIDVEISLDEIPFNGRPARLVLANDVTARRRAEEQVRQQAALLDKAQDAILVRDLDSRIQYWNRGAEQLYGWSAQEVIGLNADEVLYRDPTIFRQARQLVLETGEWFGELPQIDRRGRELLVEARWTLVRDENGAAQSILAINTDITERKKLEAQFLRAQRMESIGTLAGGIAHDLNNVLAPILLSLGMLKRQSRSPVEQKLLTTLENSAQRGADMVRQVLSFARGVEGERVVVDVGQVVRDLENLIRDTFDRSIRITVHVAADLLPVLGDPTQIHQVVLNLCVNGRDAMPEGGDLVVSVSTIQLDAPFASIDQVAEAGTYVLLSVKDTGVGIPLAIRERIFDPFFTTKELGKGTGLGLPTVQAVIKSHGGFINVYSEEGRGSEFRIYLPALEGKVGADTAMPTAQVSPSNGELVLVVDDEPAIRVITQQTLEAFGYRVLTAEGGAEAISIYGKYQQDIAVVLTDMMMPGMDGFAIMQALRKINPDVKIIAASGLAANDTLAKAARAGVSHFLQKPYTSESLLKVLAETRDDRG